jgi:hypothetical protein
VLSLNVRVHEERHEEERQLLVACWSDVLCGMIFKAHRCAPM